MSKPIVTMMMIFVVAGGVLLGSVVKDFSPVFSMLCCAFGVFMSMFIGMILFASVSRSNTDIAVNAAIHEVKVNLANIIVQQKNAYQEMLKASSRIIARRVAERTVTEMMCGLENDEQRDAAFKQMNAIVDEELDTLHKALALTTKTDA